MARLEFIKKMNENEEILTILQSKSDFIAAYPVKRIISKGKEQQRILAITKSSVFFPKIQDSLLKEEDACWWIDVTAISVVEYMAKIILKFTENGKDKEIVFTAQNYQTIGQEIADHVQHLMGPITAMKLNLNLITKNKVNFDKDSVMLRLKIYCAKNKCTVPERIIKKLEDYIDKRRINFVFSEWEEHLVAILFALAPYQRNISGVINKRLTPEQCDQLKDVYIPFKHMSYEVPFTQELGKLMENGHFDCNSIAFKNTMFDSETLPKASGAASKANVQTLAFNDAFIDTAFDVFYTESVFKKELISSLSYLNLDNTKGIKLPRLLWFIKNITILSLANCGLEVASTLNHLCSYDLSNLRCLNLSGNICQKVDSLETTTSFPSDLCRIDFSDVEFGRGCAQGLISFLLKQEWKYGARIYANSLTIPSSDISLLFDLFEKSTFTNLVEFAWCNNQTRIGLIHFIKRNQKLVNLFMDEDFADKSPGKITEFANAIIDMQFLNILSVRGSPATQMKETIMPIIDALKTMINVAVVDLSGNIFDENLLIALSNACNMNRSITDITVLNNSASPEAVAKFVKETTTKRIVVSEEIERRNYQEFPKYLTADEFISPCCQSPPYDTFIFMPDPPPEPTPEEDPIVGKRRKLFLKIVGHNEVDEDLLPITKSTDERIPVAWKLDDDIIEGAAFDGAQAIEDLENRFSLAKLVAESQ